MAPVTIRNEEGSEDIVLDLDEHEMRRAEQDSEFLSQLVAQYYAQREVAEQASQIEQDAEHQSQEHQAETSLFIWNESGILLLLSLYEENKENMSRKRHKVVYNDIAKKMNEVNPAYELTGGQCQSKINSLKKNYKKIKDHNNKSGNDRITWPYFEKMDEIFGATGWAQPVAVASEEGPSSQENPNNTIVPKKRKLDSVLEQFIAERKEYRKEKLAKQSENFEKLLKLKQEQHKEKMAILANLCNRIIHD